MRITGLILGVIAGLFSVFLWIILAFYNPYNTSTSEVMSANTFAMLCLPACLAIISSLINKKYLMLIAFIWSLPISLYLMLTPGIFAWFIVPCVIYFICFFIMLFTKNKSGLHSLSIFK